MRDAELFVYLPFAKLIVRKRIESIYSRFEGHTKKTSTKKLHHHQHNRHTARPECENKRAFFVRVCVCDIHSEMYVIIV